MAYKDSSFAELFNVPFNLYRLSPLHFSLEKPLLSNLDYYANSLTRQINRELACDAALGNTKTGPRTKFGAFKRCTWVLQDQQSTGNHWDHEFLGVLIRLEFEKKTYELILLKKRDSCYKSSDTCIYFPLLLTSLPNPWSGTLSKHLAATFGTYVHPMKLSAPFLWRFLDEAISVTFRGGRPFMEKAMKDVFLVLDFTGDVAPSLKHLETTFRREDLFGFLRYGQALLAQKGDSSTEPLEPFTTAVLEYMRLNLAMDLNHESVSISKIACGSFVLERGGKIKLLGPSASEDIMTGASAVVSEDYTRTLYTGLLKSLVSEAEGDIEWTGLEST